VSDPVPVVGLSAYRERARWGAWDVETVLLPYDYVRAVHAAGGTALVLPPDPAATADPDRVLDLLHGFVVVGGRDLASAAYGAAPHPTTDEPGEARDAFELAVTARALERDIPFLGICRGMQVMNVARGGTLHQHLPETMGHEQHRETLGVFADHEVVLEDGSLAARAAGELEHPTKSHHHQGVDRVGDGLAITGWASTDRLPEAIEDPSRRFALGVQWHPEADETSRVIAALVEEARDYARTRAPFGS
jgi:putative glutamine amidotransferase